MYGLGYCDKSFERARRYTVRNRILESNHESIINPENIAIKI